MRRTRRTDVDGAGWHCGISLALTSLILVPNHEASSSIRRTHAMCTVVRASVICVLYHTAISSAGSVMRSRASYGRTITRGERVNTDAYVVRLRTAIMNNNCRNSSSLLSARGTCRKECAHTNRIRQRARFLHPLRRQRTIV